MFKKLVNQSLESINRYSAKNLAKKELKEAGIGQRLSPLQQRELNKAFYLGLLGFFIFGTLLLSVGFAIYKVITIFITYAPTF